jgi:hypothetical protein
MSMSPEVIVVAKQSIASVVYAIVIEENEFEGVIGESVAMYVIYAVCHDD